MAGHSKYANIKHRKGAQDAKRAKVFTKVLRKVIVAAKVSPDPSMNPALRDAISAAKAVNIPKDRIEAAIKKSSSDNSENYEEMRYEGYGVGGVAVIVEMLTDNRNRSASDVRSTFSKYGGTMGETGSVTFSFDQVGVVKYAIDVADEDTMFEAALEAGASSIDSEENIDGDECYVIYSEPNDLGAVRDSLAGKYGEAMEAKLSWKAKNKIEISPDQQSTIIKMIDAFEDNDDVQYVVTNADLNGDDNDSDGE